MNQDHVSDQTPLTTACGICDGKKTTFLMDEQVACPGCGGTGIVPTDTANIEVQEETEFVGDHGAYCLRGKPEDIRSLSAHITALKDMLDTERAKVEKLTSLNTINKDRADIFSEFVSQLAAQLDIKTPNPNVFDHIFDRVANLIQQHNYLVATRVHHDHPLQAIFTQAIDQATKGKGEQRHGAGRNFMQQPWKHLADAHGNGFLTGQAEKKLEESTRLNSTEQWERELLGAINYTGMAILHRRLQAATIGADDDEA